MRHVLRSDFTSRFHLQNHFDAGLQGDYSLLHEQLLMSFFLIGDEHCFIGANVDVSLVSYHHSLGLLFSIMLTSVTTTMKSSSVRCAWTFSFWSWSGTQQSCVQLYGSSDIFLWTTPTSVGQHLVKYYKSIQYFD